MFNGEEKTAKQFISAVTMKLNNNNNSKDYLSKTTMWIHGWMGANLKFKGNHTPLQKVGTLKLPLKQKTFVQQTDNELDSSHT